MYVAKYTRTGALVWARRIGAAGTDAGTGIVLNAAQDTVIVTGSFENTVDFDPVRSGIANGTSLGGADMFILQLDDQGNYVTHQQLSLIHI